VRESERVQTSVSVSGSKDEDEGGPTLSTREGGREGEDEDEDKR
jgi:hypothetical protein